MALPAARFEAEMFMDERMGRLEERVERIQVDVADLKIDIRRIDGKVDAVRDSVTVLQGQMKDGFMALVESTAGIERAIRSDFKTEFGEQRKD
jgi:hypothetical protein